jgi:hypothetical protein
MGEHEERRSGIYKPSAIENLIGKKRICEISADEYLILARAAQGIMAKPNERNERKR